MHPILFIGILLVTLPIIGFLATASVMLHAALKDDGDGMKVLSGIMLSVLVGGAFIATYAGMNFLN